jgi:hypothetical protein
MEARKRKKEAKKNEDSHFKVFVFNLELSFFQG